jgi:hypothetical protein
MVPAVPVGAEVAAVEKPDVGTRRQRDFHDVASRPLAEVRMDEVH